MKYTIDSPAGPLCLAENTQPFFHAFYQRLEQDPALYADPSQLSPYRYCAEEVETLFARLQQRTDKKSYAVLLAGEMIGELHFKHIDWERQRCELGICLVNDAVKNKGFGTLAETLALRIAFEELDMVFLSAKTLRANTRSKRVLEKVGFRLLSSEGELLVYGLSRAQYDRLRSREP